MRLFETASEAREFFGENGFRPMSFLLFRWSPESPTRWTAMRSPFLGETLLVPSGEIREEHIGTDTIGNGRLHLSTYTTVFN